MEIQYKSQLFYNATIIDPLKDEPYVGGMVVTDGLIFDVGSHIQEDYSHLDIDDNRLEKINVGGNILAPGLVDMRVFIGEPGDEHLEDLKSVSKTAAKGGVTSILTMPNTNPVIDEIALVEHLSTRAAKKADINVHVCAAATKGLEGKQMSEIGLLKQAGAKAFSDGRDSIQNSQTFLRLLSYAKSHNAFIMHDVEDADLAGGGVMNSGLLASRLGLPSKPIIAETIMLDRDLTIAESLDAPLHISQISAGKSADKIKAAKDKGLKITAGVSINNLTLNEFDIEQYRTFLKLDPPLRSEDDRLELVEAIKDGTIDVIVSSHDPQDPDGKRHPFADAAIGAVGLETLLSAALKLHHNDGVSLNLLWKAMSFNPAKLLKISAGTINIGQKADIIIVDPNRSYKVVRSDLLSKSTNTPFENRILQGKVLQTYVAGQQIYKEA